MGDYPIPSFDVWQNQDVMKFEAYQDSTGMSALTLFVPSEQRTYAGLLSRIESDHPHLCGVFNRVGTYTLFAVTSYANDYQHKSDKKGKIAFFVQAKNYLGEPNDEELIGLLWGRDAGINYDPGSGKHMLEGAWYNDKVECYLAASDSASVMERHGHFPFLRSPGSDQWQAIMGHTIVYKRRN